MRPAFFGRNSPLTVWPQRSYIGRMKTKTDLVRFRLQPDLGRRMRLFASKHGVTLSTFLTLAAIQAMREGRVILRKDGAK